jgi:cation:H+ antiporter
MYAEPMTDFLLLAASLGLLLLAARYFVDGISTIAENLGAPKIVIGMTVVAFGTSMPELVVNSLSAYHGSTDLAFGNIVGSCLVNTGFVLGLTAVIRPMKVEASLTRRPHGNGIPIDCSLTHSDSQRPNDHTR